ncbi:MAG: diguanylate cyclase, partial [Anaerolineae bacterium]
MTDFYHATLRWLYDYAAQGVFATDAELTIRAWNRWLELHSGQTAADMIGRNLFEAYPELVTRRLDQVYERALAGQSVVLSQRFHRYLLPMPPGNSSTTFAHMQQSARIAPLMDGERVVGTISVIDDVTDRAAREDELKRQIAVQDALHEIDRAILTLDLHECLQRLVDKTATLVGAPIAAVVLRDNGALSVGACAGEACVGRKTCQVLLEVDPDASLAARVIRSGQAILLEDVDAVATQTTMRPLGSDSRCVAAAPLVVGKDIIGALVIESPRVNAFSETEHALVIGLATQAAIAIQNARLFEAEQRRRQAAATLLDTSQIASSSLELDQVLKHICRQTAAVCQARRCSIFLLDGAGTHLVPEMSQFADGHTDSELWAAFKALRVPVDSIALISQTIHQARPRLLEDPARTGILPPTWTEPFGAQRILFVPLVSHDRAVGVMTLDQADAQPVFTPEQIDLACTIGAQVAVSVENARLYARVQKLAITDSLTGLYNRRGLFEFGRREVERARRFGRPLAAIMFDLDHFKRVNDTYGHATGDQVLAGLAARCRQALREVDLLGRYGGEEFAVLLPEIELADAGQVAERLRQSTAQAPFATDQGLMEITISLGVAPLDDECADLEALLQRADQALYAAKEAGRNKVCRFEI